jgi:hypothetical protein
MKKIVSILIATLLVMALVVPAAISAPVTVFADVTPPAWATEINLIADQNINVGTVYVWNDTINLYVKYETTDEWVMTETHLAVAATLDGIPQTLPNKKGLGGGNPIPGQFAYSTDHNPAVQTYTYTIPLTSLGGTSLYIAAHAKVQLPQVLSALITASIASGDSSGGVLLDNVLHISEDPITPEFPVGYPGPYVGVPSPAVPTWIHSSWPTITGAQWISSAYLVEDPDNNSWRLFTRNFAIPSNALNITGSLMMMTADNAEEVYLNSTFVGSDGEVYGPFIDNQEWNTIESFSGLNLLPGTNILKVMVRNYAWSGGVYANPTGLIYKMDYKYQIVERELQTETAWGTGTPFSGKNWATYFTYTVQPVLLDTVIVNAYNATTNYAPTYSNITLAIGKNYLLKVSGTAFAGDTIEFDAKYSTSSYSSPFGTWTDSVAHYEGYGTNLLNLKVNNVFVDWGAYTSTHVYNWNMAGDGAPLGLELWIYDTYPSNNSGYLTVEIYLVP